MTGEDIGAPAAEHGLDAGQHLGQLEGFGQMVVGAGAAAGSAQQRPKVT